MGAILTAAGSLPIADSWGMHDVGTGWWLVMMLLMILFWAAVIFGVLWLARGGHLRGESKDTPAEILNRRLADGTLTPEEYERRRRLLTDAPPSSEEQAPQSRA